MATRYTDVDLLILNRWEEVKALKDAFDELLGRMGDVMEYSLKRVSSKIAEKGFKSNYNYKSLEFWFWKPDWENKKGDPIICLDVQDYAPAALGKGRNIREHPSMWLEIADIVGMKKRDPSAEFGRAVKSELTTDLRAKWDHVDADEKDRPLGMDCTSISDLDRVRLIADPAMLESFLDERINELMELVPATDKAFQALMPK